jgi:hypothetical protein
MAMVVRVRVMVMVMVMVHASYQVILHDDTGPGFIDAVFLCIGRDR